MNSNNIHEHFSEPQNTSSDLSEDDDLVEPWENFLQYLNVYHMKKIFKVFHKPVPFSTKLEPIRLTKEEFINAIDKVVGNSNYSYQALSLFNEVPCEESEKITWAQFIKFYKECTPMQDQKNFTLKPLKIFTVPHFKIDSIIKIVPMETNTTFGYAIISKYGKIGLYDGNLKLLLQYNMIFARTDVMNLVKPRHKKSTWINDAVFVPNLCLMIISSSASSIMIYDANSLKHKPLLLIEGIPFPIQCITFNCNPDLNLYMGDDQGSILVMKFTQSKNGFFRRKYTNKLNAYFWRELKNEKDYVNIQTIRNIHANFVHSIIYVPQNSYLVTCSKDPKASVIFYNIKDGTKEYVFKIGPGTTCLSISHNLRILMTGSDNGMIRIWNSVVTSRPIAAHKGHKTSVVDVQIFELKRIGISCSRDGILKVWDLVEHTCQQTVFIEFPAFHILGKSIEWSKKSIISGPKRYLDMKTEKMDITFSESMKKDENILRADSDPWNRSEIFITCCNYIAIININYDSEDEISKLQVLPPPAMQNDVIVPENWKMISDTTTTSADVSTSSNIFEDEKITDYVKDVLKKIENLDIVKNLDIPQCDINLKIASLENKKAEMKGPVSKCAPYLALDLYEVEEPRLSQFLPEPRHRKAQRIADRAHRLLSAASYRTELLSDRSSKSRSSRSSVVEF